MHHMDNLMALIAVGVGLAGTVALWFLGMLGGKRIQFALKYIDGYLHEQTAPLEDRGS